MSTIGLGPHGEKAFPADKLVLTESEAAAARAGRFSAAIVLHTTTSDWSRQELAGIIGTLGLHGAEVTEVVDCGFDRAKQNEALRRLAESPVHAVISLPIASVEVVEAHRAISRAGKKLVLLDNAPSGHRPGVDYLAVSFPKSAEDMNEARERLVRAGGFGKLVAKIERAEAIRHLESITEASDAVMVARGDLGVEVGYAELTGLQKRIIRMAQKKYRVVITATQMMESMITSPAPTRAEVSDVANAVMDGTDAVMLSAESAVGKYPIRAVEAMAQVIEGAEKYQVEYNRTRERIDGTFHSTDQAIAMAVMYTANHIDVKAIFALTESGSTTLWMSRVRSDIPIYAFTRQENTRRRVTLYRGVYPVAFDVTHTDSDILYPSIMAQAVELGLCKTGDSIIVTKGEFSGVAGGTNAMKILRVNV